MGAALKDMNHLLRTCPVVDQIWRTVLSSQEVIKQGDMGFDTWLTYNLNASLPTTFIDNWQIAFPTIL